MERVSVQNGGLTLLEVLLAGTILTLALIPAMGLFVSSSKGVVGARDRAVANFLGMSLIEEQRSRRVPERGDLPETAAQDLPWFRPILQAYGDAHPDAAPATLELLGAFRCRTTLVDLGGRPTVKAEIRWTVSGRQRSLSFETRLETP